MNLITNTFSILLILNIFFAIAVIFFERRSASTTWAWLMILLLIPGIGFILYLLFGQNLSRRKIFQIQSTEAKEIANIILEQKLQLKNNGIQFKDYSAAKYKDMIHMHLINSDSVFTQDNEVKIFTDGREKFDALFNTIEKANDHIHLVYYIIKNDQLGKQILDALTKKAAEGVKVRLLYDAFGCRFLPKSFFKKLKNAGGEVAIFFPFKIPFINFKINYRNHRKLAIIDGKYAFIGGFNIGDEYLGLNKKMGYWRDTHLKISGSAVYTIQIRFSLDWNNASSKKITFQPKYFPKFNTNGETGIQIVSSGPDSEWEQIKNGYIKMIYSAKENIYIQTPYFIPDESLLDAIKIASLSGIDVRIMIPNKPDHIFVYWATYSYIGELIKTGAKCYIYEAGFIHAKTIVVDGKVASVGTANVDIRSFRLNFEVNAFIYDTKISNQLKSIFEKDIEECNELTLALYKKRSAVIKVKESVSRLVSPIL
ncbi:MAG: cardiolipin synthase [Halanaerobiales bacterium]|nr:cardiolipin synthase [Halanaerobiales bacterium]